MNNSKIEWTDHTFNAWHGCMKVSDGCKNCYAEVMDNRWKGGHWEPGSSRKAMSDKYWEQPLKWNAAAAKAGKPARVFCASMADVFEGTDTCTNPDAYAVIFQARIRLFTLIYDTPHLIWQLLTKRPNNIRYVLYEVAGAMPHAAIRQWLHEWLDGKAPANVWVGTSVENQHTADTRIDQLLDVPAKVRFLSCEPLIGPLDLRMELPDNGEPLGIHWIIAGGESGRNARPCHPDWVRSVRDQCQAADVPFFFKQWGEWGTSYIDLPTKEPVFKMYRDYTHFTCKDWVNKGDACISIDGRLCKIGQDFQECAYPVAIMQRVGKGKSGRLLDGMEWNEFPQ